MIFKHKDDDFMDFDWKLLLSSEEDASGSSRITKKQSDLEKG